MRVIAAMWIMLTYMPCDAHENQPTANHSISGLLAQPLWQSRDAYDASHHLMVPLHAAFASGSTIQTQPFDAFFTTFLITGTSTLTEERLDRLHFLYFYTRYIVLKLQYSGCTSSELNHLKHAEALWRTIVSAPAWQWDRPDFPSLFERVRWKLDNKSVGSTYQRAIIDEELFALAISADFTVASRLCNIPLDSQHHLASVLTRRIYTQELTSTSTGGWIFQKGVWTDHPDFEFAGQQQLEKSLKPAKVSDISPDSSHSFRQALFLISFGCAEHANSSTRRQFQDLMERLSLQLLTKVIIMPSDVFHGIRLSNYMDGENGVYRYNYATQGKGNGFGPYQLSGSFNLGWWSFLGTKLMPAHLAQRSSLPFSSTVLNTYTGPNTSRQRNPAFAEPGFHSGALIKQILDASLVVSRTDNWCPE